MKYFALIVLLGSISALKVQQKVHDEVDDLLEKQDKKDEEEV